MLLPRCRNSYVDVCLTRPLSLNPPLSLLPQVATASLRHPEDDQVRTKVRFAKRLRNTPFGHSHVFLCCMAKFFS